MLRCMAGLHWWLRECAAACRTGSRRARCRRPVDVSRVRRFVVDGDCVNLAEQGGEVDGTSGQRIERVDVGLVVHVELTELSRRSCLYGSRMARMANISHQIIWDDS